MEQREVGVLLSRLGRAYQRLAGDESVATGVRPVRADGGSADFRRGPLVDALCGLSCMRDPRSRAAFAEALDEDYGIAATLTGDARIDIARMVRAALRVSQGVHALVETTELFAGAEVAAQIGCLLDPVRQDTDTGPDLRMDAPLGWEEQAAARRPLSMPPLLPVRRPRDGLVRELAIPLSPDLDIGQLFSRALTLNNQPDGLPPSVLLLPSLAVDRTPGGPGHGARRRTGRQQRSGPGHPPPVHGPESAVWLPLRGVAPGVPLEDLDPYRDLDGPLPPARLDIAEFAAWRRVFGDAVEVLGARTAPGPGRLDPGRIRSVIPWGRVGVLPPPEPTVRRSATTGDAYGAMVRTHAFAVRPGVPRTADEFLAADDPEAATSRYARLDPVDPHVRAGRLVAYATLHPGRTARRILARPEPARLPGSATPR